MKFYNRYRKKFIELERYEKICDKCYGKGDVPQKNRFGVRRRHYLVCDKCYGDGKLDWIDNIIGKTKAISLEEFNK